VIFEKPLYSPKVTVWAAFNHRFLLEPYFFDGNVTADSYCTMIHSHAIPLLKKRRCFSITFYQQHGAPAHTSNMAMDLLKEQFGSHLISKKSELFWPPYGFDIAPPDYFRWGYLKSEVYRDRAFTNLTDLKHLISTEMSLISKDMLQSVCVIHFLKS
jgi:hypothetical protein